LGRIKHAQNAKRAATVFNAIDHHVIGAHHNYPRPLYTAWFVEGRTLAYLLGLGLAFLVQRQGGAGVV
jgi:hypothetical protein